MMFLIFLNEMDLKLTSMLSKEGKQSSKVGNQKFHFYRLVVVISKDDLINNYKFGVTIMVEYSAIKEVRIC